MPNKIEFEPVSLETPGFYSFSDSVGNTADSTDTLDATIASFVEMENLIKKNFMMAPDKLEMFANNNPTQLTLRELLEERTLELEELKTKHKKMIENFYNKNKDDSSKNQMDQ